MSNFLVSDDQGFQNGLDLHDIRAILPYSTLNQQLVGAVAPSGKTQDEFLNADHKLEISGWNALTLLTLFHTNHIFPFSADGTPWINTIVRHSKTPAASTLFQFLLASSSSTADALSEIIFKEALLAENVEVARLLLDCFKIDPNALLPGPWPRQPLEIPGSFSIDPRHPLEVAIRSQNAQMVQLLLNHDARSDEALETAISSGSAQILQAVISSGQANRSDAFIGFVWLEDVSAVERLLDSGMSADSCDPKSGCTALICAITVGSYQLTEVLIKKGADVNLPIEDVLTPLHVAAFHNHLDIAKLLLDNLAQIEDPYSRLSHEIRIPTPLQTAVYRKHFEMTSLLLEWGADVNAPAPKFGTGVFDLGDFHCMKSTDGLTSLMMAFSSNEVSLIRMLLDHHVCVDYSPSKPGSHDCFSDQTHGRSALADALRLGASDITRQVLDLGAPSFPDALRAAAENGDTEMMQNMLDQGVDVNHLHWDKRTALTAAIEGHQWWNEFRNSNIEDVCAFLLENGAQINREGACPTALGAAIGGYCLAFAMFLVERGANIHFKDDGQRVLEKAIGEGDLRVVKFLVKQDVDVNFVGFSWTPLNLAIRVHEVGIVKFLIKSGANLNYPDDGRASTPTTTAIQRRHKDIIRLLIKHGVACDQSVILRSAARYCDLQLFEEIIGAACSNSPDFGKRMRESCLGHGALFTAIKEERNDILEILLGIDINLRSPCVSVAMRYACSQKDLSLMRRLYSAGAPVDAPKKVSRCMRWKRTGTFKEPSPLFSAVLSGFKSGVQFLLEKGADPSPSLTNRDSILCVILKQMGGGAPAQEDYLAMFEALIHAGTDVNLAAWKPYGRTALQKATEDGNSKMVDRLVDAGADVNGPPVRYGGVTALQAAAIGGYLGIAEKLINIGAYVDAQGAEEEGRTALEGAAEHGRLDMVQLLLNAGAGTSPSAGRQQFANAVKMARRQGHNAVAKLLEGHQAINRP